MKARIFLIIALGFLTRCTSMDPQQRRFLDSTFHSESRPGWTTSTKAAWEEDGLIKYRGFQSIKGNERLNGCYDLARLNTKQSVASELDNDISGKIHAAGQSISENAELIVGKAIADVFGSQVRGLRFTNEYFERYMVANVERIDCYVIGELSIMDYNILKRNVVDKVLAIDERIREAVAQQQIKFFQGDRERDRDIQGYPPLPAAPEKQAAKAPPMKAIERSEVKATPIPQAQPAEPSKEAVVTSEEVEE